MPVATLHGSLERYRRGGHRAVEGWLSQRAVDAICELDAVQRRLDLFESQHENVDLSGQGSRTRLIENLERHGCDRDRVKLLTANSMRLKPADIVSAAGGSPRLFSIDGGHTAEATANDLRLAHDTVREGGIVILDDYFNPAWPGVSEGACRFMAAGNQRLHPVAITANKFFLAQGAESAETYRKALSERHPHARLSTVFGEPVACFERPTLEERIVLSPQWRRFRETRTGRALRRTRAWLQRGRAR